MLGLFTKTNVDSISKGLRARQTFIWDPSLVLYIPLWDETDGASFISKDANAYICTVTGAVWTPQGRSFNGTSDKITILQSSILAPEAGTIEGWVKCNNTAAGYLFSENGNEYAVYLTAQGAKIDAYYDSTRVAYPSTVSAQNTFIHIAFTFIKSGTGYVYQNGILLGSGACSSTAPTLSTVAIGGESGADGYLLAVIGEVRIYNRALSALEVQWNYLATKWRYR